MLRRSEAVVDSLGFLSSFVINGLAFDCQPDPNIRLSAAEALEHPWIAGTDEEKAGTPRRTRALSGAQERLRESVKIQETSPRQNSKHNHLFP